ncbi:pirin family protein [Vibrio owensii]|uniref:Pirin n=1 Tax=Vibrio owensii CAIM 1854 = LMG 25443 TaxID=1229493 RepID=A0A0C1W887_9VIBR|nr:pirin family protein [Vibrio owensii]KIF52602.1 pirin [Vibrio owensii CAIM 1854 = LMG 25443]
MITVRHANDRGRANFGWLDSKHSFSFGSYYDPQHMGFSELRVINDDVVEPNAGFDTHGHRDMEIISYVLQGVIAHKDSEGNASDSETLRFLQIWIQPNTFGNKPGYQQKDFGQEKGLTTIATPTGENGTLHIKQDATLHQLILDANSELSFAIESGRNVYVHQVEGVLKVDNTTLTGGDGAKVEQQSTIVFRNDSDKPTTALVFDLP